MTLPTVGRSRSVRFLAWSAGIGALVVVLLCAGLVASERATKREQDRAGRSSARLSAERARTLLGTASGDGELTDAEISAAARQSNARSETVTRGPDGLVVVLEVRGVRPGLFGNSVVRHCYLYIVAAKGDQVRMTELDGCPTG